MPDFLLVHGAPVNYFEYILDKAAAARAFAATDARIVFVGHTHIAEYWSLDVDGTIGHKHMQHGGELRARADSKRYIIDVGSVGQPRDLNPRPRSCSTIPSDGASRGSRYEYPIAEVQKKMREAGLPAYLVDRLSVGR